MMMHKVYNKLLILSLVLALLLGFNQYYLIQQSEKIYEINQRQKLEIIVYRNELEEQQKIHANLNEKNRELRVYTNFLESQNAMLMEKESEAGER